MAGGTVYDGRRAGPRRPDRPRSGLVGWVILASLVGGGCVCGGFLTAAAYWAVNG